MNIFQKLTLKTLGKNRVRTLVTIIGIILSAAMFTAVTTCVSSLQHFLVEGAIARDGDWHGAVYNISRAQLDELSRDGKVESLAFLQNIGYAELPESENEYKPYLFIGGMSQGFADSMPVYLTEGRMPENASELMIPKHLKANGGVNFAIGDKLSLNVGSRTLGGAELGQNDAYVIQQNGESAEKLALRELRSYTVVGIYERPGFEPYSAPGFTALTISDETGEDSYGAYIKLKTPKEIEAFLGEKFPENGRELNSDYLRFTGNSNERTFNAVLFSLAGVLTAIIMFGSVSLIYNAFSISVSERTKQFGILSSVGATKKQLTRSVLFEALALCAVGLPLGALAGLAGIGLTLKLSEGLFKTVINIGNGNGPVLHLFVSWEAVAAAALIGLVTVLISAAIPARRAVRISAIDAIRQTGDIAVRPNKVKTSKLTYKLFGLEGMLASKNFKRNKRKYRATVVSLFMSVVLFISASSFSAYLQLSAGTLVDDIGYDVGYTLSSEDAKKVSQTELLAKLSGVRGVTESGYARVESLMAAIPAEYVNPDLIDFINSIPNQEFLDTQANELNVSAVIYFVDDATYTKYLDENSLDKEALMNTGTPRAVALDFVKAFGPDGRYHTFNLFGGEAPQEPAITLLKENGPEGYFFTGKGTGPDNKPLYYFQNQNGDEVKLTRDEAFEVLPASIGSIGESAPFNVSRNYIGIALMYPYGAADAVMGTAANTDGAANTQLSFKTKDHKAAFDQMAGILEEEGLSTVSLMDYAVRIESNRAVITVVNIFSIGFIVLISLIAAANVFNTISTNIALRRREFAMLKSIGMTEKGFNKMMNFECLLYGLKGLVYGIPVSVGVTWLIYQSILNGWETGFFIPWHSIVIAVSSVFAVVFATMLYAMDRIKKDNPIDALKNENL